MSKANSNLNNNKDDTAMETDQKEEAAKNKENTFLFAETDADVCSYQLLFSFNILRVMMHAYWQHLWLFLCY